MGQDKIFKLNFIQISPAVLFEFGGTWEQISAQKQAIRLGDIFAILQNILTMLGYKL
jgi:hypothetical protein